MAPAEGSPRAVTPPAVKPPVNTGLNEALEDLSATFEVCQIKGEPPNSHQSIDKLIKHGMDLNRPLQQTASEIPGLQNVTLLEALSNVGCLKAMTHALRRGANPDVSVANGRPLLERIKQFKKDYRGYDAAEKKDYKLRHSHLTQAAAIIRNWPKDKRFWDAMEANEAILPKVVENLKLRKLVRQRAANARDFIVTERKKQATELEAKKKPRN